jgi:hypothetical protein
VEVHRTAGMTAIAIISIVLGVLEILNGLFRLCGTIVLIYELLRLDVFELPMARLLFSLLILATGIVGVIAGFGTWTLRPWTRPLNLVFGGLLILSIVSSYFIVPIISSIGTYDLRSLDTRGLARLIIFGLIDVVLPVSYAPLLFVVLSEPAWKTAFANGKTA